MINLSLNLKSLATQIAKIQLYTVNDEFLHTYFCTYPLIGAGNLSTSHLMFKYNI